MTTKTSKRFVVITGGYTVGWAPKFETRREAEEWMNEDHGWEERTEVAFEGDTVRHNCDTCKSYTEVDDLSSEEDFSPRWLCVDCQ